MCDAECRICWFRKSDKVVHQLQLKSLEITGQLNEVTKSVQIVQDFIKDFAQTSNHLEQLKDNKPDCFKDAEVLPPVETKREEIEIADDDTEKVLVSVVEKHVWDKKSQDNIVILTVSSGLANDGTFWCRPWSTEVPFNDSRLHEMSDEFAWLDKDLAAEKAEMKASDELLFCYSQNHELYLRTIILKYGPPADIEVRFVDIGTVEFVSTNTVFYKVPDDNLTKHPFLNIFCSLYQEDPKLVPREAKWYFRDITEEKVLLGRIVGEFVQNGMKCQEIEMKTMTGSVMNINTEIKRRILKCEKEEKRKSEDKKKIQKKSDNKNSTSVSPAHSDGKSVKRDGKFHPSVEKSPSLKDRIISDEITGKNKLTRCNSVPSSLSQIKSEDALKQSSSLSNIASIDLSSFDFKKKNNHAVDFSVKSWVDEVPEEDRRLVPPYVPPLRNLFYNKNTVRQEKWDEIELMNIRELLKSESKINFYAFILFIEQIEQSIWQNMIYIKSIKIRNCDLHATFKRIQSYMGTHSQYFFILDSRWHINGLARIEAIKLDVQGAQLDISYYSLSSIVGQQRFEWSPRGLNAVGIKCAKSLVEKIKESLESGKSIPILKNYFPWCGVPPLVKFVKPTYPDITQPNQERKNNRDFFTQPNQERKNSRDFFTQPNLERKNSSDFFTQPNQERKNSRDIKKSKEKKKKVKKDSISDNKGSMDDIRGKRERKDSKGSYSKDDHRQSRDSSNRQNRDNSPWEVRDEARMDTRTHGKLIKRRSSDDNWRMSPVSAVPPTDVQSSKEFDGSPETGCNGDLHIDIEVWNNETIDIKENVDVAKECLNEEKKQMPYPFVVDTSSFDDTLWDEGDLRSSLLENDKGSGEVHDDQKNVYVGSIDDPERLISMTNGTIKLVKPVKIVQRPTENIGYYDSSGVWYPDDSAIIACQLSIPPSRVEVVAEDNSTENSNHDNI